MFHPLRGFSGNLGRSGVAGERCVALRWSVFGVRYGMLKHGARRHLRECLVLAISPHPLRAFPEHAQSTKVALTAAKWQHSSIAARQHGSLSESPSTEIRDQTPTPETSNPGRRGPDAEPPN